METRRDAFEHFGPEVFAAARQPRHRGDELGVGGILRQIARRAGCNRAPRELIRSVHAQDQYRQPRPQLAHALQDIQPAAIGKRQVEHDHAPRMRVQRCDRIAAGTDFVDDGPGERIGEDVAQPAPDDRMIVDEHHSQRRRTRDRGIGLAPGRVERRRHELRTAGFGIRDPGSAVRDSSGVFESRIPSPESRSSGSVSSTRVPWPARLVMRSVPPSLRARSLMPSRPSEDRTFSRRRGMPTPLSLTYSIRRPRLVVPTVMEMQLARAWRTALVSASSKTRKAAVAISVWTLCVTRAATGMAMPAMAVMRRASYSIAPPRSR